MLCLVCDGLQRQGRAVCRCCGPLHCHSPFAAMKMNGAKDRIIRQGLASSGAINYKISNSSPAMKDLGHHISTLFSALSSSFHVSTKNKSYRGVIGGRVLRAHPMLALPKAVIASLTSGPRQSLLHVIYWTLFTWCKKNINTFPQLKIYIPGNPLNMAACYVTDV